MLSNEKMKGVIDIGFGGILHLQNIDIDKRCSTGQVCLWTQNTRLRVNNIFVYVTNEDGYMLIGLNHKGEELTAGRLEDQDPMVLQRFKKKRFKTVSGKIPTTFLEEETRSKRHV